MTHRIANASRTCVTPPFVARLADSFALSGALVSVLITVLYVPPHPSLYEANPVMAAVIGLFGWEALALAKFGVVLGLTRWFFPAVARAGGIWQAVTPMAAANGAGLFALLMVVNAMHDVAVVSELGAVSGIAPPVIVTLAALLGVALAVEAPALTEGGR